MAVIQISKFQVRRGQEKTTGIPQLDPGEFGWAEDTEHLYIGKRITEGANTDANSRILTDKDLNNFFGLLGAVTTSTTITPYQYKSNDPAVSNYSKIRLIQDKLDDFVSVLDFVPVGDSLDSISLQSAIRTIFANTVTTERKTLRLPAGTYSIDSTVFIPAYTTLIGEGPGATVLVSTTAVPMFQTVSNNGLDITDLTNQFPMSGVTETTQPKNIHIEGMTLKYQDSVNFNQSPLLCLDNAKGVSLANVIFGDALANAVISTGTALQIRGNSADISLALTGDITVDRCKFYSVGTAIHQDTGTTNQFKIHNSEFSYLGNRGIEMWGAVPGADGPKYGTIQNNNFNHISREAIYIGTATTTSTSYIVTSDNVFGRTVGQNTAIVVFNDAGNVSSNDRYEIYDANNSTTPAYYNPLVSGNAKVEVGYSHSSVISPGTNYTDVLRLPLTGSQQMATITYRLINDSMSRAGTLTMNTNPNTDGTWYSSVSDYYNYSERDNNSSLNLTFSTDFSHSVTGNYVSLTCLNKQDASSTARSTATVFEYQLTLLV